MGHQKRTLLTCLTAAAVALLPVIGTAADKSHSPTSVRPAAPRIAIDNFGQINANYYRGAQPEGRDYKDLATLGVKTVIDLQADGNPGEEQLVKSAGMKFHRIPMTTRVVPTEEQLSHFMKLVNDPANQPVYVHCAGGRHRTGVMTAAYRINHDRWNAEQAFKEMKDYKFGADFLHPEFKRFVYAYHVEPQPTAPAVLATGVIAAEPVATR
jgi:tyrosine-protein phosphatase SIW14